MNLIFMIKYMLVVRDLYTKKLDSLRINLL